MPALKRKAYDALMFWKEHKTKQAMLVDGARQVGKTYIVRQFARENYEHLAEINFIEDGTAAQAISTARNAQELFARITAFASGEIVAGKTLIFLDEVQECKGVPTAIKFLVDGFPQYDFVLSGSLLGVELKNIKSVPVGYLDSMTMYPLDLEEYCCARGLPAQVLSAASASFEGREPVDPYLHERLMGLFHEYLIVGGMPAAVDAFVREDSLPAVRSIHRNIVARYREDITKYARRRTRTIRRIYDLVPAELAAQDKRFILSDINGDAHIARYENSFLWLADAGVALPVYNVSEPRPPLLISQRSTYFKLFMNDVGLLTYRCGMEATREMLAGRTDVAYGAIYENYVAQKLAARGMPLYYFKSKAAGELDFLVENSLERVLPIEVKSGKTYKRHRALKNVLEIGNYSIDEALVLCEENIEVDGKIVYAPMYCTMFMDGRKREW